MRHAVPLLCLLVAVAAPPAAAGPESPDALRAVARDLLADTGVRGAGVALLRGGELVWLEGFGVADERRGAPVTPDTLFQTASLGKVVAAYAALLRVQDGDWQLDMPATSPRLDVAPGCAAPRLVDLLAHTAGLGNDLRARHFSPSCRTPAAFAYAGQGYLVLQDLFGDQAGEAAESFVRARLFEPLGMKTATYRPPPEERVATGHVDLLYGALTGDAPSAQLALAAGGAGLSGAAWLFLVLRARRRLALWPTVAVALASGLAGVLVLLLALATRVVPTSPWSRDLLLPASLHANTADMARFAGELLHPRLLTPALRDRLCEPIAPIDARLAWGAGAGVDRVSTSEGVVETCWQWGSNPGFQGLLVWVPARGDALVVLTNTGGFADIVLDDRGGYLFARRLARRALGLDGRWRLPLR